MHVPRCVSFIFVVVVIVGLWMMARSPDQCDGTLNRAPGVNI